MNEMLEIIKHYTISAITPLSWFSHPYSKQMDAVINSILLNGKYLRRRDHVAIFDYNGNIIEIWIGNYPYSYGGIYAINNKRVNAEIILPYMQTRKKLKNFIYSNREIIFKNAWSNIDKEK